MMTEKSLLRFVRILAGGGTAKSVGAYFIVSSKVGQAKLDSWKVTALVAEGILSIEDQLCRARPEARSWLKRQMADHDHHAAQHRMLVAGLDDVEINVSESPLAKLAHSINGKPAFLSPHHLLAGERIRGLVEKAHLVQRTTMSYDPTRVPVSGNGASGGRVEDMAIDARKALSNINKALPSDCAGVVFDVCGHLKGLQQVETERQWPRRSAKLVLRIGLEQAATYFGYSPIATGDASRREHNWLGEGARPTEYG